MYWLRNKKIIFWLRTIKENHQTPTYESFRTAHDKNSFKIWFCLQKGNTALHIASLAGHEDIVKMLVEHEAKINVQAQVRI